VIKLKAEVAGKDHQISIQRREAVVLAEVDGRRYKLKLRDLGDSEYLLIAATPSTTAALRTATTIRMTLK